MANRKVLLMSPHGMCAGVNRALAAVEFALEHTGSPVWVLHEIVHNTLVVRDLEKRGVRFAEKLEEIPAGAVLLFSAHGVPTDLEEQARAKNFTVVDATCPLVSQLHRMAAEAKDVLILIGHREHPEVVGILGRSGAKETFAVAAPEEVAGLPSFPERTEITLLTQTTFNTGLLEELEQELRKRYPQIRSAPKVCYATANRQKAARLIAGEAELVLIIGSPHSSNSNRLREIAEESGARALLVESAGELPLRELEGIATVGVGAGASAPESEVRAVLDKLAGLGFTDVRKVAAAEEKNHFKLPEILEKL